MTPIELRQASDRATASLQAMRDAADVVEDVPVEEYDGPEMDEYRRIFDECLRDLREPAMAPMAIGWGRR